MVQRALLLPLYSSQSSKDKCSVLGSFLVPLVTFSVYVLSKCPFFFPSDESPPLISGFLWSPVARQVLHCVAEAVLDDDAVHRGFGHPQLQPDGPL